MDGGTHLTLEGSVMSRFYVVAFAVVTLGTPLFDEGWWLVSRGQRQTSASPDSFSARNQSYYLRPVPTDKPRSRATAEEVWRDLFPGMAKDRATPNLLRRLYGGLPVEFVVLDERVGADEPLMKAPGEGFAVSLRVANCGAVSRQTPEGETLFGLIALGRTTLIEDAMPPDRGDALARLSKAMKDRPSDMEAWDLAVEDYLLRHDSGWLVVGGSFFDPGRKLPTSPSEHRADLDGRIQAYVESAADYYDRVRGRK
jgi:hypothetical protein